VVRIFRFILIIQQSIIHCGGRESGMSI
jgi:hypothetical protein